MIIWFAGGIAISGALIGVDNRHIDYLHSLIVRFIIVGELGVACPRGADPDRGDFLRGSAPIHPIGQGGGPAHHDPPSPDWKGVNDRHHR